jgi:hypothetical protein
MIGGSVAHLYYYYKEDFFPPVVRDRLLDLVLLAVWGKKIYLFSSVGD